MKASEFLRQGDEMLSPQRLRTIAETARSPVRFDCRRGDGTLASLLWQIDVMADTENPSYLFSMQAPVQAPTSGQDSHEKKSALSSVLDLLADEIYLIDPDTLNYHYLNKAARERMADPTLDYRQLTPADLFSTFDEQRFRSLVQPLLDEEQDQVINRRDLPNIRMAEITMQLFDYGTGQRVILNQIRDLSDRLSFEEEMSQLRVAVDASQDIIAIIDPDSLVFDYINPAGMRQLGIEPQETDLHMSKFFPEFEENAFSATLAQLCKDASESKVFKTSDLNRRILEIRLQAVKRTEGNKIVALARDVSRRNEIEARKRQFISTVSHELKTPMTALKGSVSMISESIQNELPGAAQRLSVIAKTGVDKLESLINNIVVMGELIIGRLDFELEVLNLNDILRATVAEFSLLSERTGVPIKLNIQKSHLFAMVDQKRARQVFENIIANALAFSQPGGSVELSAGLERGLCVVRVRDHGMGIPEDEIGSIFDTFHQVGRNDSSAVNGVGLGLSIVKELVERQGGTIDVSSRLGEWTEFTVRFPKADAD